MNLTNYPIDGWRFWTTVAGLTMAGLVFSIVALLIAA